jgi:hypothetical protein
VPCNDTSVVDQEELTCVTPPGVGGRCVPPPAPPLQRLARRRLTLLLVALTRTGLGPLTVRGVAPLRQAERARDAAEPKPRQAWRQRRAHGGVAQLQGQHALLLRRAHVRTPSLLAPARCCTCARHSHRHPAPSRRPNAALSRERVRARGRGLRLRHVRFFSRQVAQVVPPPPPPPCRTESAPLKLTAWRTHAACTRASRITGARRATPPSPCWGPTSATWATRAGHCACSSTAWRALIAAACLTRSPCVSPHQAPPAHRCRPPPPPPLDARAPYPRNVQTASQRPLSFPPAQRHS